MKALTLNCAVYNFKTLRHHSARLAWIVITARCPSEVKTHVSPAIDSAMTIVRQHNDSFVQLNFGVFDQVLSEELRDANRS